MKKILKEISLKKLILAPIVPLLFLLNFEYLNTFKNFMLSMTLTFVSIVILILIYAIVKINFNRYLDLIVLSIDWFLIDILNFLSNDNYKFLFSSIAETLIKNSLYNYI